MFALLRRSGAVQQIEHILTTNNLGVHKRIDENRELLELLIEKVPDFMLQHSWVLAWFRSQDEFLTALAATELAPKVSLDLAPRPFPKPNRSVRHALRSVASDQGSPPVHRED